MLYPSIDRLLEKSDSKYILVSVASKRARQLKEYQNVAVEKPVSKKHVGMALEEFYEGHISFEKRPSVE
jgi:DNA-directed RNA polymerase subunit omega